MNNEELKKKICEIIAPYVYSWGDDERIADALIAAGLTFEPIVIRTVEPPDECEKKIHEILKEEEAIIEEITHRAEVAERALDKAVKLFYEYRIEFDVLSCSSCWIAEEAFKKCEAQGLYKDCLQQWKEEILIQAEKELAEEGK